MLLIETMSMILQIHPHTSALSLGFLLSSAFIFSIRYPTTNTPGIFWQMFYRALKRDSLNLLSPTFSMIKGIIITSSGLSIQFDFSSINATKSLFITKFTSFQSLKSSFMIEKVVSKSQESAFSKFITLVLYFAPEALMFLISYSGNPYYKSF